MLKSGVSINEDENINIGEDGEVNLDNNPEVIIPKLEELTVAELKTIADGKGIEYKSDIRKDKLIQLVQGEV